MKMAVNRPDRAEKRRQEASERRETWTGMTPQEQLAALDARLGTGAGAVKQRNKLVKLMAKVVSIAKDTKKVA